MKTSTTACHGRPRNHCGPSGTEDLAVARLGAPEGALRVGAEEGDLQTLGLGRRSSFNGEFMVFKWGFNGIL